MILTPRSLRDLTEILIKCSDQVLDELGSGWKEEIYQKAMEVALRKCGLVYENQRILPITFSGHVIGDSIPDLVVWLQRGKEKIAVIVDLKTEYDVKDDHRKQVEKYIRELKKQLRPNESVSPYGLVINFVKESNNGLVKENLIRAGRVQVLKVKHNDL